MDLLQAFDDAQWHADGEFPVDLPTTAAATHIGMFLAWCADAGLLRETADVAEHLVRLRSREATPGVFAREAFGGSFTADDLTDEGAAFTTLYYGYPDENDDRELAFDLDYVEEFINDGATIYHVPDSWSSYDRISAVLTARFTEWDNAGRPTAE